jgi:hypothetical protein
MMATKKELQELLNNKILEVEKIKLEFSLIEKEYARFTSFLGLIAHTMREIYSNYPAIVSECTTDTEFLRLLKINVELNDLIDKIKRERENNDNEKGWKDEI